MGKEGRRAKNLGGVLLLEFDVDEGSGGISDGLEGSCGEDHGGCVGGRPRNGGLSSVNDLDLNGLARNAGSGSSSVDAPHLILPAARRPIVPYPFPCRPKHVARRELRCIAAKTRCRCSSQPIVIIKLMSI